MDQGSSEEVTAPVLSYFLLRVIFEILQKSVSTGTSSACLDLFCPPFFRVISVSDSCPSEQRDLLTRQGVLTGPDFQGFDFYGEGARAAGMTHLPNGNSSIFAPLFRHVSRARG